MSVEIDADDLVPDRVTAMLGVAPTHVREKGKSRLTPDHKHVVVDKFGRWALELRRDETDEWDVAEAAKILLGRLPAETAIWKSLSSWARIRLSIALTLESFNQGFSIDPVLARQLADREMLLDLDIYADDESPLTKKYLENFDIPNSPTKKSGQPS